MSNIILTESQFRKVEYNLVLEQKQILSAQRKWNSFTPKQKKILLKLNERIDPKNKKLITEAWWNNVLEIAGWIDPTPISDMINAISYFSQGEKLFAILSLISAFPGAGDIVAKPIMRLLKTGDESVVALKTAVELINKGKKGEAQKILSDLAYSSEPSFVSKFLRSASGPNGWATQINKVLDEFPSKYFGGLKNLIQDYFTLFSRAATKGKVSTKLIQRAAHTMKPVDINKAIDVIENAKIFDPSALSKPGFFKNLFLGGNVKFGRSPEGRRLRIMMQSTKWWLGFLDYIGVANFIGPEELLKQMGEEEYYQKLQQYNNSSEGQQNFDESITGEIDPNYTPQGTPQKSKSVEKTDPFENFFSNLFFNTINPLP